MWLVNARTRLLESFVNERSVQGGYAILSHTWGDEELTFDSLYNEDSILKKGYKKVEYACLQALQDRYQYVWIDTCCIDKRSSAELSEAINSMFRWDEAAEVCYAFLFDVELDGPEDAKPDEGVSNDTQRQLRDSRWFKRGW